MALTEKDFKQIEKRAIIEKIMELKAELYDLNNIINIYEPGSSDYIKTLERIALLTENLQDLHDYKDRNFKD